MTLFSNMIENTVEKVMVETLTVKLYERYKILSPKARDMLKCGKFNPTTNYSNGYRDALIKLGFIKPAWHHFLTDKYVRTNKKYQPHTNEEDLLVHLRISLPYDQKDLL